MPITTARNPTLAACPLTLWRADEIAHPERGLARGEMIRVRHGVYAMHAEWQALSPWNRYLARVYAVALLHPEAVFCHESAAALLGLPILGDPIVVHVIVSPGQAAREVAGIRSHRSSTLSDVAAVGALLATSVAATAVTIARHRHPAMGLATVNAAMRLDTSITSETLAVDNETRSSSRGRRQARWSLERATGVPESVLESLSQAAIEWLGFPAPQWQRRFVSESGIVDRGDAWWEHLRLVGEADGEFKYDGRFGDPAALLRQRRERDRRLLSGEVARIAHWGWIEVAQVIPLRDLLSGHGLEPVRAADLARLRSLSQLLAPYGHVGRT